MGTVTLNYGYDGFGARTSLADNQGGSIAYSYDDAGDVTGLDYTASGVNADVSLTYANDGGGTMTHLATLTMSTAGVGTDAIEIDYGYPQGSNALSLTGNGIAISAVGSLNGTLADFQYAVSDSGQLLGYTGPAGSTSFNNGTLIYHYDGNNQLTSVTDPASTVLYSYGFGANGNRTSSSSSTTTASYSTTTGNEMTAGAGDASMTYDYDGNLTSKVDASGNLWTYTWDYRNRLTQVVETTSGTTVFTEALTYDIFNNLIGVATGVVTPTLQRSTVFDGKNPYMDFNSSGTLTYHYLANPYNLDQYFARVAASGSNPVDWYIADLTGFDPRDREPEQDDCQDKINYDPFGNIIYQSNTSSGNRFNFDGGEWDANLALYRFGDRWQDPKTGAWISQDPIGFAAGDTNLYRFNQNDPTVEIDPTGHEGEGALTSPPGRRRAFPNSPYRPPVPGDQPPFAWGPGGIIIGCGD